jgi:glutamate-5-semialdehyde dehydrogenase
MAASEVKLNPQIEAKIIELRRSARAQRRLKTEIKNSLLNMLATNLEKNATAILAANKSDLQAIPAETTAAFRDRLTLNDERIAGMAESLRQVAVLPDPVGETIEEQTLANGLRLRRVRAPLGLIFMVFESRPNVILEAFSLAFKSGNLIALRGGSESRHTAEKIYQIMRDTFAASAAGFTPFYGIEDYDRLIVEALLKRNDLIDVVVPRGGDKLIEFVQKTALMPIIKNDRGMCHAYVDEDADLEMAVSIVANAKTQRPGVCNALETVLVHTKSAEKFILSLYSATDAVKLTWRVDAAAAKILQGKLRVQAATNEDWDKEYLDLILNCRVVSSYQEALEHIDRHGSKHSEVIITKFADKARQFQEDVDAAVVYWNASTRFTDGYQFGLGGELGISTQKLHVRGPVGLRELTTPRWLVDGKGQIRS